MGTEKTRQNKINWYLRALEMLSVRKETAKIDFLIPMFCINNNCTERTGREILDTLEKAGKVIIKDGKVSLPTNEK